MKNRFEPEALESQPFSFEENERDRPARHARQHKPASRRRAAEGHAAVRRRHPVRPRPRPRFPVRFPIFAYPAWPGSQLPEPTPAPAEDPDTQEPTLDSAQDGTDATQSETGPGGGGSRYVRHVQRRLNKLLGLRLPLDGKLGVMTRAAIRSLQRKNGLPADGIIRPRIARILSAASQRPARAGEEMDSEIDRGSYEYGLWVQRSLNRIMGSGLVEDGIIGTHTRSAIRDFQRRYGLLVDGIVGPQTEGALIKAGAAPPPGDVSTDPPVPSPAGSFAWGAKVSPEFRSKVQAIAKELKFDPNHLMAAMAFETNESFSPSVHNPYSGATGLIQFISPTARDLGTTTDALARMTAIQQLDYVKMYLQPFKNQLHSLEDFYMAILSPDAIGKPNGTVLMSRYSPDADNRLAYDQNAPLDADHDGKITKSEAAQPVRKRLEKGLLPGNASAA